MKAWFSSLTRGARLPELRLRLGRWSLILAAAALWPTGAHADAGSGLQWLQLQTRADGTLVAESAVASESQTHCEVAATLLKLAGQTAPATAVVSFASPNLSDAATETAACVQQLSLQLGQGSFVSSLERRRFGSLGYGAYEGFRNTNALDTGWALGAESLRLSSIEKDDLLVGLQTQQAADGSFSVQGQSGLLTTATVLRAIHAEVPRSLIAAQIASKAASWLLQQRLTAGYWAEDVGLTALVYEAVHPYSGSDGVLASQVRAYLLGRQQSDGSWSGDAYVTALALRALALTSAPVLDPTRAGVVLKFVDARTATPVPGVVLSGAGPSVVSATSDASGRVEMRGLNPGKYQFNAAATGYAPVSFEVSLLTGQVLDLGLLQLIVPSDVNKAVVSGVVRDHGSSMPLPGVSVQIAGQGSAVTTGADGSYLISNVTAGAISISASKAGYFSASGAGTARAGEVLTFSPSLQPDTSTSTLVECKVRGMVTDASTGLPLGDVSVSVGGAVNLTGSTDSSGRYSLSGLANGQVVIVVSKPGFDGASATTRVTCSPQQSVVVEYSPKLYAIGSAPPHVNKAGLTGIVLDSATNQPLSGVSVAVVPELGVATTIVTGADGRFAAPGLDGSTADLVVQATGYAGLTLQFSLLPGELLDLGQIRLRAPKVQQLLPDLQVVQVFPGTARTDPQLLQLQSSVQAIVANSGTQIAPENVTLIAFSDVNRNNAFDPSTDAVLGQTILATALAPGQSATVQIASTGPLAFRDAPVSVIVDPFGQIVEINEANNVRSTADAALRSISSATAINPALKWFWSGDALSHPTFKKVISTPVVGRLEDTNGDGLINDSDMPYVVFVAYENLDAEGVIRIALGDTGALVRSIRDPAVISGSSGVALADLNGDGRAEIIGATTDGRVVAFDLNGVRQWLSPVVSTYIPEAAVTVADLNADGSPEIIYRGSVISSTGQFLWKSQGESGSSYGNSYVSVASAADLFGTGTQDVMFGATVYTHDGVLRWRKHDGYPAPLDINGDGTPEIAVVFGRSLYLYTRDGGLLWQVPINTSIGGGPPVIADFDKDGVPDIGVSGTAEYVVFRADGSRLWSQSAVDGSGVTGSTVFDFDGDTQPEVIYFDQFTLRIFDGPTGRVKWQTDNSSGTIIEYPLVADVDMDGRADLLVVANDYAGGVRLNGVRVFSSPDWVGVRSTWNQHAYSITNINEDLSVPRRPEPSWKASNTYRQNIRTDGDPRAVPDLTLGYARVQDGGPQPSSVTWRIGNAGGYRTDSTVKVALLGQRANGTNVLIATAPVGQTLQKGQYVDVSFVVPVLAEYATLTAVVDDDGTGKTSTLDFDRNNNTHSIDVPSVAVSVSLSVTSDKPAYAENEQAVFTAPVTNGGSFAREVRVRFSVLDAAGRVVQVLPLGMSASVPAGGTLPVLGTWGVGAVVTGGYQVKAELLNAQDVVHGVATVSFVVQAGVAQLNTARIGADRLSYSTAQSVQLIASVANQSANEVQNDLQAVTNVENSAGAIVFNRLEPIAQLVPADQRQFAYNLVAGTLPVGTYRARLELRDTSGAVLSQSTTTFKVEGVAQTGVGLVGELLVSPASVVVGQNVQLNLAATNNGSALLDNLPVTVRLVDPASGALRASFSANIASWPAGSTQSLTWTWPSQGANGETLIAVASALVNSKDVVLSQSMLRMVGVGAIDVQPRMLNFGQMYPNQTAVRSVVVSSMGSAPATGLSFSLGGSNPAAFFIDGTGCAQLTSLPVATTCSLTVMYRPVQAGNHSAKLLVAHAGGSTTTVDLVGFTQPVVFGGSLLATATPGNDAQEVNLSYSLLNPVDTSASGQFMLEVRDSQGLPLANWEFAAQLDALGGYAGNQSFTAPAQAQTLTVVLSQLTGTVTTVLATTSLYVTEGSPQYNVQLGASIAPDARLLVLASCPGSVGREDDDDDDEHRRTRGEGCSPEPDRQECINSRVQGLGAYLRAQGIEHKIVTSEAAFKHELRCGGFNTYWLSGGSAKLDHWLVKEIREAVWRGDGLILDGEHDDRNQLLHPVAGVKYRGKLSGQDLQVDIPSGSIFEPGSLATRGRGIRFDLAGGQSEAQFADDNASRPAIISSRYGAGASLVFAFDLASMLSADPGPTEVQLNGLVNAAASHLASTNSATLSVGDVVAVALNVSNQGSRAASLQLIASVPAGLTHSSASLVPDQIRVAVLPGQTGTVSWTLTLPPQSNQEVLWRVRVDQTGEFVLPVVVLSVTEGSTQTAQTIDATSQTFTVQDGVTLRQQALPSIQALQPTAAGDLMAKNQALQSVGMAQSLHGQGRYPEALVHWMNAANALIGIRSIDTRSARDAVALALEASTDTLCQSLTCFAGNLALGDQRPALGSVLGYKRSVTNSCPAPVSNLSLSTVFTNQRTGQVVHELRESNISLSPGQLNLRPSNWKVTGQVGDVVDAVFSGQWQGHQIDLAREQVQVSPALQVCRAGEALSLSRFTAFGGSHGLFARGGHAGGLDWEWALGSATSLWSRFDDQHMAWVSGRNYQWALEIDSAGRGIFSVKDGANTLVSGRYSSVLSRLRTGDAIALGVQATSDVGSARVSASLTRLQGQSVGINLNTDGVGQQRQIAVYQPLMTQGLSAEGTVRMDFAGSTPPRGSRLQFSLLPGVAQCR